MRGQSLARRRTTEAHLKALKAGLLMGAVSSLVSLIGMVEAFSQRDIIAGTLSMGHTLLIAVGGLGGYLAARGSSPVTGMGIGMGAGIIGGGMLGLLALLGSLMPLRRVLINASPALFQILTFGQDLIPGILLMLAAGATSGLMGSAVAAFPLKARSAATSAIASLVGMGVLQDLLRPVLAAWGPLSYIGDFLFEANGVTQEGSIVLVALVGFLTLFWKSKGGAIRAKVQGMDPRWRKALRIGWASLALAILLMLPQIVGLFLSEVLTTVGLYVLLGLGLNIVVGFAGLLDLGYVAFFAIGSYTVAVLTSPELGFFNLSFWVALPIAIVMGTISGVLLGIPVLKMRGDYLAIATLGFGEIIRILVLSDFLRPWLGGAQGIGKIPKASIGGFEFATPQELYYLILAGCALVGVVSWRLRDSRIGRAWMAMREDEDVAQATGINLVATKLLAFATGAAFSALSGAIFATKLGSVYPHSFNVMISINILCLIIVGGMGSIPGVVVGAAALVGLPELLREFAEYRLLVYGAALVAMMLLKPEGLWPEAVHKRELHKEPAGPGGGGLNAGEAHGHEVR